LKTQGGSHIQSRLFSGIRRPSVDIARKSSIEGERRFIEKNTLMWVSFLVGVVIGFVAVYIIVAQPMLAQLDHVQRQLALVEDDMQALVGERSQAWETGTLLSDLKALKAQLQDARGTVREIRNLRQDLLEEARYNSAASEALSGLARLQGIA